MDHLKTQRQLKAAHGRMKSPRKLKLVVVLLEANRAMLEGKKGKALDFMGQYTDLLDTLYFSMTKDGRVMVRSPETPNQFKRGGQLYKIVGQLKREVYASDR